MYVPLHENTLYMYNVQCTCTVYVYMYSVRVHVHVQYIPFCVTVIITPSGRTCPFAACYPTQHLTEQ